MSSERPPMTRTSTKYEDIPPRFRKVWVQGHREKIQRKLDAPIDDFRPKIIDESISDTKLPESIGSKSFRAYDIIAPRQASTSAYSTAPLHKRQRTDEFESVGRRDSGEGGLPEREEDASCIPIAYSGPSSIRLIVDSVVNANVALSTPPVSRSNSPLRDPSRFNRYRHASCSRPATRTSSPATSARSSTPTPSGWAPLTSRHSLRRFDIRPWGPRHLEYDYYEARKEFQGAAYYALGQYGYEPPKGVAKYTPPPPEELPSMSDLRKIPDFSKACRKLDAADRALEEALSRGETWDNTPIPKEYLEFSLEDETPEDFCVQRPDNATTQERSRSSVTLEEAAGQLETSLLGRSTTATSVPSSASPSEGETESVAGDESQFAQDGSPIDQTALSDKQLSSSGSVRTTTMTSSITGEDNGSNYEYISRTSSAEIGSPTVLRDVPQSQPRRKRLHDEIENEEYLNAEGSQKEIGTEPVVTHPNSPSSPVVTSVTADGGALGRTESESASGSGTGFFSISSEETSAQDSPPSSITTDALKITGVEGRGRASVRERDRRGLVAAMRGRGRGRSSGLGHAAVSG